MLTTVAADAIGHAPVQPLQIQFFATPSPAGGLEPMLFGFKQSGRPGAFGQTLLARSRATWGRGASHSLQR